MIKVGERGPRCGRGRDPGKRWMGQRRKTGSAPI